MSETQENLRTSDLPAARINGALAETVERSMSIVGHSMRAFQEEGMRFLTRRIEENAKAAQAFGSCKSLPELMVMQQRWFADMTRAYGEEWARYGDIVSEALNEGEKATEQTGAAARRETH